MKILKKTYYHVDLPEILKTHGLTANQIARWTGIDVATINRMVHEERVCSEEKWELIQKAIEKRGDVNL